MTLATILTRSVSEDWVANFPRLRFGLLWCAVRRGSPVVNNPGQVAAGLHAVGRYEIIPPIVPRRICHSTQIPSELP